LVPIFIENWSLFLLKIGHLVPFSGGLMLEALDLAPNRKLGSVTSKDMQTRARSEVAIFA